MVLGDTVSGGLAALGERLDSVISQVFSSLTDSGDGENDAKSMRWNPRLFLGCAVPYQSLLGLSALFLPYNSVIVLWYKQQTRGFISSPAHLQGQNEWSPLKQKQNTCKDIPLLIKPKLILQMYRYAKLMKIRISWKQLDQTVAVVKAEVFREKERQFQGFALFTILMTFITWLTRMLPSPMSLANSNMRFYCVCFLLLLLSKWCPSTLP